MRAGQETLREGNIEHLRRFGFNERTNSHIPSFRYYRRPHIPEATIFSIPVKNIENAAYVVMEGMVRAVRLNPFSQQIPGQEKPQT